MRMTGLVSKCSATPAQVAATPLGAQQGFRGPTARDTLQGGPGRGATGRFGRGVAAISLKHTRNCRKSCDGGVATPWSATAAGVASAQQVPKRGSLKSTGKRQESATFLQRSFFNVALQFFACCSAAFGQSDIRIAERPMMQCKCCSAAFRKLQRSFRFCLWHVAEVGFRL